MNVVDAKEKRPLYAGAGVSKVGTKCRWMSRTYRAPGLAMRVGSRAW